MKHLISLIKDIKCLFDIFIKAKKQVLKDDNVNIIENVTIFSLTVCILLKLYNNNIPIIK